MSGRFTKNKNHFPARRQLAFWPLIRPPTSWPALIMSEQGKKMKQGKGLKLKPEPHGFVRRWPRGL